MNGGQRTRYRGISADLWAISLPSRRACSVTPPPACSCRVPTQRCKASRRSHVSSERSVCFLRRPSDTFHVLSQDRQHTETVPVRMRCVLIHDDSDDGDGDDDDDDASFGHVENDA